MVLDEIVVLPPRRYTVKYPDKDLTSRSSGIGVPHSQSRIIPKRPYEITSSPPSALLDNMDLKDLSSPKAPKRKLISYRKASAPIVSQRSRIKPASVPHIRYKSDNTVRHEANSAKLAVGISTSLP
jgi:hypothetical protein